MSHFAGYLRDPTAEAPPADPRGEEAVCRLMARSPELVVQSHRLGQLWVVTQGDVLVRSHEPPPDGRAGRDFTVIVGDPIVASGDEPAETHRSQQAVVDALASGHPDALRSANGTFAAMSWQAGAQRLTLVADKIGGRPVYYKRAPDRWLFASSLRLLRALAGDPERFDEQGFAEALFLGQPLGARTHFQDIRILRPAEWLDCQPHGAIRSRAYADPAAQPRSGMSFEEAVSDVHRVFRRAVLRRLRPGLQEAFLSGGMDSRAVVAALVDEGQRVHSFCSAFDHSIDDVVSRQVASQFGTRHYCWNRTAAERVRYALDPFALYARDHFPAAEGVPMSPRRLWSGDGGSVTMGHVYLTEQSVALAAGPVNADTIRKLFPSLTRRPTRQASRQRISGWAELAIEGALEELRSVEHAAPDRRLFHFYMRNDQAKHLLHHFEAIDQSQVELLTPFFDGDVLALVSSLPINYFLSHRLYNEWIKSFRCGAGDLYWQPYRGHLPSPHPMPESIPDQWDQSWYRSPEVRRSLQDIQQTVLRDRDPRLDDYIDRRLLRFAGWLGRLGSSRYDFEINYAQTVHHVLRLE